MKNRKTPKPGSKAYDVEQPQKLNSPEFNSSTERRDSKELPAQENMNNQEKDLKHKGLSAPNTPKTDLGNGKRDKDEDEREKIITP